MKQILLMFCLLMSFVPTAYGADSPGMQGFKNLKYCIMQNDTKFCRAMLTPSSDDLFTRFNDYKLMPCLPTDFTYESETTTGTTTMVTATMPASPTSHYIIHFAFENTPTGPKLDVPGSLKAGLGDKWEDKIALSEQLYLMMRQNMGDKLTCDMLNNLVKK